MNYNKKTIRDFEAKGKKILLRCDFNVPICKETGKITDETRIISTISTIKYLLMQGASVIACSHMGKPKGEWRKELSLAPVATRLSQMLGQDVKFVEDIVGEEAHAVAASLGEGEIMLLENLRFDIRETKNDREFARQLASMADIYVSDAFGTVHRAHASTAGIAEFLPAYSGLLVDKELSVLGHALSEPDKPFAVILGGSKVADKIAVIENLITKADTILIGGGMAFTFIKAMGYNTGNSLLEEDKVSLARELMKKADKAGVKFLLPVDVVVAKEFSKDSEFKTVHVNEIPDGWMGLDIGPKTAKLFAEEVLYSACIIWNGPMGVFEFPNFANGTLTVAQAMAEAEGETIIGGGDSAAAIEKTGLRSKVDHISTGGGASLELLEGKELPGLVCLLDK